MAVKSNLVIPTEGHTIDNDFFQDMVDTVNYTCGRANSAYTTANNASSLAASKARFYHLASGTGSADDWMDDESNWMPYSAYSQYDWLVFNVCALNSAPQSIWVPTNAIEDDGTFRICWQEYSNPGTSSISIYFCALGWDTSYVSDHSHGGDLSENSSYNYRALVKLQASTPTYSRTAMTYRGVIKDIYGVKIYST